MLVEDDGLPVTKPPDGYPIELPSYRLLHDDPGHPADIVTAVERAGQVLVERGGPAELCFTAEVRDLRKHLRDKFFTTHVTQYSASRRYAPIYWQLGVPSRSWGLWLYAPSLTRESLFAVARAGHEKLDALHHQASQIRDGLAGSDHREARERVESLEGLATEVEKFVLVADEVAHSGWEPDLNDGFVLNAAPLEELFVHKAWKTEVARQRKALQRGVYPWATVQQTYYGA